MDPGPVRNEEGGRSKRRTSILKLPRKSILSTEVEQQDDMLECTKPSDKRISRRVSFAPDLPLYAKDVKNTSSTRSPLQELASASGATQNSVQMKVSEDQQFTGVDTILSTHKQVFQQRAQASVSEDNFGEKTIMFNANDLDMTHCHTIKITNDKEVLNMSHGILQGEKTILFDRSMDMTLSQTLNMTCDQELSFLSKPTPQSALPFTSTMAHGIEFLSYVNTDKENLVPKLNASKKMGNPNVALVGSEDDLGVPEANPLQCLFPPEIYAEPDMRTKNSKDNHFELTENASKKLVNFQTKDEARSEKTIIFSDEGFMDMTQNWTSNIVEVPSVSSAQNKYLRERRSIASGLSVRLSEEQERAQPQDVKLKRVSSCQGLETSLRTNIHQTMADFEEEERKEKTVRFSTDDACMDVTHSHTAKISSELQPDLSCFPMNGEKTVRFTANDAGIDITQCLTVNIAKDVVSDSTVVQKQGASDVARTVQSVDLDFENFFASLSNQNSKVNTSEDNSNKPVMERDTEVACEQKSRQRSLADIQFKIRRISHMLNSPPDNVVADGNHIMPSMDPERKVELEEIRSGSEDEPNALGKTMVDFQEEGREKTVRFSMDDACMDVTHSHTAKISSELQPDLNCLPMNEEKTVRFTANDAGMDITQCLTVNIGKDVWPDSSVISMNDTNLTRAPQKGAETFLDKGNVSMNITEAQKVHKVSLTGVTSQRIVLGTHATKEIETSRMSEKQKHLVGFGAEDVRERTVRFAADNALVDVTGSHTIHISTNLKSDLPFSEKTVRFDAEMDATQCHTVNITNDFDPSLNEDFGALPKFSEKTDKPGVNNNTKYDTKSLMVLQETNLQGNASVFLMSEEKAVTKSDMSYTEPQMMPDLGILPRSEDKTVCFSSNDGGMEVTQCLTSKIGFETDATETDLSPIPSSINVDCLALKKREPAMYTNRRCRSLSAHGLNTVLKVRRSVPWGNKAATSNFETVNVNKNVTQSHVDSNGDLNYETGCNENTKALSVIEERSIAEISQKEECKEDRDINLTEVLPVQMHKQTISEEHDHELMEPELTTNAEERGNSEEVMSKVDVDIKVQANSPKVTDEGDVEDRTECSPSLMERDTEVVHAQKSRQRSLADIQAKIRRFSQMLNAPPDEVVVDGNHHDPEPNVELQRSTSGTKDEPNANADTEIDENRLDDAQEELCHAPTTPFRMETGQLLSRLSVGRFKPKLPRRSKSEEGKTPSSSLADTAGDSTKTQSSQAQKQMRNFDLSVSDINDEELESYEDTSEEAEVMTSFCEFELDQELQDEVFEEDFAVVNERKRPFSDGDNKTEDKKRMRSCNEDIMDSETCALEDENMAAVNPQTADYSNCSQTASVRCEATFDSTCKQSLFESQLEDYSSDIQRKFDDGTLTMAEFFKLFHVDSVIQNPRQSMIPGKPLTDTESTLLDLRRDRHISLPRQLVYEASVQSLSKQVEGFKARMRDLGKPLALVNRTVWREMEQFSETEFKSFGAKVKERHGLYRKMSKAQSHEMKETLYSDLIQANVEEQKKLSGSIERADVMLKSLDDCIAELEAGLAKIEDDVKFHQEELTKVTNVLDENKKSTAECEILKEQSITKARKVKEEAKNLEKHLDMIHMLNEWKLVEIRVNTVVYSFLHETLHLLLDYEESEENTDERKIVGISFKHKLDERSQCHARLVHTLVSQFTQEKDWTKKYSSKKHVPQLLHNVSLVVNRCRELGEEVRRIKTWGSLRFDILDIHCRHSEVCLVFSSLKRFAKFEIVFTVTLKDQLCALELKSFKNFIGSTTSQHVEEIVASTTPGQKYFTKIIKNIHKSLLC